MISDIYPIIRMAMEKDLEGLHRAQGLFEDCYERRLVTEDNYLIMGWVYQAAIASVISVLDREMMEKDNTH